MRGDNGKIKRSEVECVLIDYYPYTVSSDTECNGEGRAKILLLKAFFEIYDDIEGTQHSEIVKYLYFRRDSASVNLQKIASKLNMDMTTLWRYRKKYVKVMEYLRCIPTGSNTEKLIDVLTNGDKNKL